MPVEYPLINGNRYQFASIEVNVADQLFKGYKEIAYSHKLEPGKVKGTHKQALGRTAGDYEAEGSLTMYRAEWDALRTSLGPGYMQAEFNITVSYADDGQDVVTDELLAVRIKGVDHQHTQGTDPLAVKLNLDIMQINEGGLAPISDPLYSS